MLCSCASYNQQSAAYYSHLQNGNFEKASEALSQNKLLKKSRNRLLYLMEKGKMEHLLGNYEKSNRYFNEADHIMESNGNSAGDVVLGYLMNPMMETYQGEAFERYMLHYYKALNYLQLKQPGEALVEARRITISSNLQDDLAGKNKYGKDAFALMLQGLIYEANQELNNAFISYRNAAEIYLGNKEYFYGVKMPLQLKKDVIRLAYLNGFREEFEYYKQKFRLSFSEEELSQGELIIFWENGLAPVKEEYNLLFDVRKNQAGDFRFVDRSGNIDIPFAAAASYKESELLMLTALRIVLPRYRSQPLYYNKASIIIGNNEYYPEVAQDVNELAFSTLRERWLGEISKTLTRLAIKRLSEMAVTPKEKEDKDEKEKKDKEVQAIFATGLKIFNLATEKADTRNWQSLPYSISYTRIPLQKGKNTISLIVEGSNGHSKSSSIEVDNTGGLYFKNFCTLRR